jgi:hypothetical protein
MGGYDDYNMQPPGTDRAAAGICFAKGTNADVPPQWVIYITVEDLERGVARCTEIGGKVLSGPRSGFCIIQDPPERLRRSTRRSSSSDPVRGSEPGPSLPMTPT